MFTCEDPQSWQKPATCRLEFCQKPRTWLTLAHGCLSMLPLTVLFFFITTNIFPFHGLLQKHDWQWYYLIHQSIVAHLVIFRPFFLNLCFSPLSSPPARTRFWSEPSGGTGHACSSGSVAGVGRWTVVVAQSSPKILSGIHRTSTVIRLQSSLPPECMHMEASRTETRSTGWSWRPAAPT